MGFIQNQLELNMGASFRNLVSCKSDRPYYWVMPTSAYSCKIHNDIIIYFSESSNQPHYQRKRTNQKFSSQFEFHHSGSMLACLSIQKIAWNTNSFWKWCHGWTAPVIIHFSFPAIHIHLNHHCKLNMWIKAKNIFKYTFLRVYWLIDKFQGNRLFRVSYSQENVDQQGRGCGKSDFDLNTTKPLSLCQLEITSFFFFYIWKEELKQNSWK